MTFSGLLGFLHPPFSFSLILMFTRLLSNCHFRWLVWFMGHDLSLGILDISLQPSILMNTFVIQK